MIPRLLHFTWVGPNPMPEQNAAYIEGWRALHPDWQVKVWGDADVPPLRNQAAYDAAPDSPKGYVLRSDLLRQELLLEWGGIYLDCDVEPIRALDDLLTLRAFACDQGGGVLGTAVLGTEPHNPTWRRVVAALSALIAEGSNLGPLDLTPIIRDEVTILPSSAFYPYLWNEDPKPPAPDTYGIHRWDWAWR